MERGRMVEADRRAGAGTFTGSGRAPGDAEQIHHWVATGDWQHLTEEWEAAKEVLLSELDGRDLRARDAACALIVLGREECVGAMIASLKAHGMIQIAEAYLNSGHPALYEAAAEWVCRHGWMAEPREGMSPVRWGSRNSTGPGVESRPTVAIVHLQPGYDRDAMIKHENALRKTLEASVPEGPMHEAAVLQAMEPGRVTVINPNRCAVAVALRSKRDNGTGLYGYGKDFGVAAGSSTSVGVRLGEFDIYYVYATDPTGLFRGDRFSLSEGKQCDCQATIIIPP